MSWGNQGNSLFYKQLQTVPQPHMMCTLLFQSHSPAFTPSIWNVSQHSKLKLSFLLFPTKDKQQQLFRQNCQHTLITVNKQTQDYNLLMRSVRLYRSGFSNCSSLNKGALLIIGFVLYDFEKFAVLFKWCDLTPDLSLEEFNRNTHPFSWPCFRKAFGHKLKAALIQKFTYTWAEKRCT